MDASSLLLGVSFAEILTSHSEKKKEKENGRGVFI